MELTEKKKEKEAELASLRNRSRFFDAVFSGVPLLYISYFLLSLLFGEPFKAWGNSPIFLVIASLLLLIFFVAMFSLNRCKKKIRKLEKPNL